MFKNGGLESVPPGVPLVDPSSQNPPAVKEAAVLGVHHLEEGRGQSHMITMVECQW